MANYKRNHKWVGRPALLEDENERAYTRRWLQPIDESRVPVHAYVFDHELGWRGWRMEDPTKLELTWPKQVWKEVPNPFEDTPSRPNVSNGVATVRVSDSDDEPTMEVETP